MPRYSQKQEVLLPPGSNDQYLMLEGQVSAASLQLVQAGLPPQRPPQSVCCFVSYAATDIPLATEFTRVSFAHDLRHAEYTQGYVRAVTQQGVNPTLLHFGIM